MIEDNALGAYLKDRRTRLDPAKLGILAGRRRTPGLRREEVAERAQVSAAWYTWLEQGRGGRPSLEVLERIAGALQLAPAEREHLFILAHQHPSELFYPAREGVSPRLRHVLDSLPTSPAYIKTAATHLLAWNRAAAVVLDDYVRAALQGRSLLQFLFGDPEARARSPDWHSDARFAVAAFRLHAARSGADDRVADLVDKLCRESSDFRALWAENDVNTYGEGNRRILHPVVGALEFEYSVFSVEGQPSQTLVIYTPAGTADMDNVRRLIEMISDETSSIPERAANISTNLD